MITPTAHEKNEWRRLSDAAWACGNIAIRDRYRDAAGISAGEQMTMARFDRLQEGYRNWLNHGVFPATIHQAA